MGLLADYLPSMLPQDPNQNSAARQGLLQFGAALLGGKGNFGSIMGQGIAAGAGGYNSSLQALQQKALIDAQTKHYTLGNDADQAKLDEPGKIASILGSATPPPGRPVAPAALVTGQPAPLSSLPQMTPAADAPLSMIPQSSMPGQFAAPPSAAPVAAPADDYATYKARGDALANAGLMTAAKVQYDLAEKAKPKVKDVITLVQNGKRVKVQTFDDGRPPQVLDGFDPDMEKLVGYGAGSTYNFADPFSGKTVSTAAITQSEDSKASIAEQRRGHDLAHQDAKASRDQNKPPAGYRWTASGELEAIPGGPAGAAGKMSEDQAKASGWVVQAENAWKNMRAVGLDKNGNLTAAARPGYADVIADLPMMGGIGNSRRSAGRQKFVQASSSLSEALLRAATGAGVNKEEAAQKVAEITPVWGEDEETTKQKMDSIPLYLESLKMRAGPGAAKAAEVLDKVKPLSGLPKNPQAKASAPAQPFSDAEKERRYQEWKRSHSK